MANKCISVYALLSWTALFGAIACFYVRPEMMTLVHCFCFAYVPVLYVFFRIGLDDIIEKPIFGISSWLALIAVEIAILFGVGFWWLPLCATLGPTLYFAFRALVSKKYVSFKELCRNIFAMVLLTYGVFVLIELVLEPLCNKIF